MSHELLDELNNDCIDSALLVDHWLHHSVREKESINNTNSDENKRDSDRKQIEPMA